MKKSRSRRAEIAKKLKLEGLDSSWPYKSLAVLPANDFLTIMDKIQGTKEWKSKRKQQWVSILEAGKLICPFSKELVHELRYDLCITDNTYHFNFYSEKGNPLTVDHITPKSLGGSEMDADNLQPALLIHNSKKGSNINYIG